MKVLNMPNSIGTPKSIAGMPKKNNEKIALQMSAINTPPLSMVHEA